ncbi:FecCD family ABC transporter permease [Nocardioides alcanivorans]|uniref:FecCD family ABC transporter permease n=1 Tax=Nocardioides alcanivorans TaxID=2897352 RepID=UPI0024B23668|nr:iron ABC transporter permease [Nocardioides alcanivorans]
MSVANRIAREPVVRVGRLVALPVRRRTALLGVVLGVLIAVAATATLTMGLLAVPLAEVPGVFFGDASPMALRVYDLLTGPRLMVALGAGVALGVSGALFQSVTRNPLGSPDVIGVSAGAGAGAAYVGLYLPGFSIPLGAVIGAAIAVGLVAVSTGSGLANPMKMVLAGIGVSALAVAFTQYVVYVANRDQALALTAYINGSLNARSWDHVHTIWLVLACCALPLLLISKPLGLTEMGDEVAASLGVDGATTRRCAVVLSVVLAGERSPWPAPSPSSR